MGSVRQQGRKAASEASGSSAREEWGTDIQSSEQGLRTALSAVDIRYVPGGDYLSYETGTVRPGDESNAAIQAWQDGKMVGSIWFEPHPDEIRVWQAWIEPEYRQSGLLEQMGTVLRDEHPEVPLSFARYKPESGEPQRGRDVRIASMEKLGASVQELANETYESIMGYEGEGGHKPPRPDIAKMKAVNDLYFAANPQLDQVNKQIRQGIPAIEQAEAMVPAKKEWEENYTLDSNQEHIIRMYTTFVSQGMEDVAFERAVNEVAMMSVWDPLKKKNVSIDEEQAKREVGQALKKYEQQHLDKLYRTIDTALTEARNLAPESYKLWPRMIGWLKENYQKRLMEGYYPNSANQQQLIAGSFGYRHMVDVVTEAGKTLNTLKAENKTPRDLDINKMSFDELEEWFMQWKAENREAEMAGEVVYQYKDGWTMQRLQSAEQLQHEGDTMGHCVGDHSWNVEAGNEAIYSLRDAKGQPHVTMAINGEEVTHTDTDDPDHHIAPTEHNNYPGTEYVHHRKADGPSFEVTQIMGNSNKTPKPEYQRKVREFLDSLREQGVAFHRTDDYFWPFDHGPNHDHPGEYGSEVHIKGEYGFQTGRDWDNWTDDYTSRQQQYIKGDEDAYGLNEPQTKVSTNNLRDLIGSMVGALTDDYSYDSWNHNQPDALAQEFYHWYMLYEWGARYDTSERPKIRDNIRKTILGEIEHWEEQIASWAMTNQEYIDDSDYAEEFEKQFPGQPVPEGTNWWYDEDYQEVADEVRWKHEEAYYGKAHRFLNYIYNLVSDDTHLGILHPEDLPDANERNMGLPAYDDIIKANEEKINKPEQTGEIAIPGALSSWNAKEAGRPTPTWDDWQPGDSHCADCDMETPTTLWHLAPSSARADIMQNGLRAMTPNVDSWGNVVQLQPHGVYLFSDEAGYRIWLHEIKHSIGPGEYDVWRVDNSDNELELKHDWLIEGNSWYDDLDIEPSRLTLDDTRTASLSKRIAKTSDINYRVDEWIPSYPGGDFERAFPFIYYKGKLEVGPPGGEHWDIEQNFTDEIENYGTYGRIYGPLGIDVYHGPDPQAALASAKDWARANSDSPEYLAKTATDWLNKPEAILNPALIHPTKSQDLYHTAPTSERNRILTHGLQPSNPSWSGRWGEGWLHTQPIGIYAHKDPEETYAWTKGEENDIWRIPIEQINYEELYDDPLSNGFVIRHSVEAPELFRKWEDHYKMDHEREQSWDGVYDGSIPYPIPEEWGIGQPTSKTAENHNPFTQPIKILEGTTKPYDDQEFAANRRPIVWSPVQNTLYIGQPRTHHGDLVANFNLSEGRDRLSWPWLKDGVLDYWSMPEDDWARVSQALKDYGLEFEKTQHRYEPMDDWAPKLSSEWRPEPQRGDNYKFAIVPVDQNELLKRISMTKTALNVQVSPKGNYPAWPRRPIIMNGDTVYVGAIGKTHHNIEQEFMINLYKGAGGVIDYIRSGAVVYRPVRPYEWGPEHDQIFAALKAKIEPNLITSEEYHSQQAEPEDWQPALSKTADWAMEPALDPSVKYFKWLQSKDLGTHVWPVTGQDGTPTHMDKFDQLGGAEDAYYSAAGAFVVDKDGKAHVDYEVPNDETGEERNFDIQQWYNENKDELDLSDDPHQFGYDWPSKLAAIPLQIIQSKEEGKYGDMGSMGEGPRRPFIVDQPYLYLGGMGSYHHDLLYEFDEIDRSAPRGEIGYWDHPPEMHYWGHFLRDENPMPSHDDVLAALRTVDPNVIAYDPSKPRQDIEDWEPKLGAAPYKLIRSNDKDWERDDDPRRPFILDPNDNTLYLGALGGFHHDLESEFPHLDNRGDAYRGEVAYDGREPEMLLFEGTMTDVADQVRETLRQVEPTLDTAQTTEGWEPKMAADFGDWEPMLHDNAIPLVWQPPDDPNVHMVDYDVEWPRDNSSGLGNRIPYIYHKPTMQLYVGKPGGIHPILMDYAGLVPPYDNAADEADPDYFRNRTKDLILGGIQMDPQGKELLHSVYGPKSPSNYQSDSRGRGYDEAHRAELERLVGLPINDDFNPDKGFSQWWPKRLKQSNDEWQPWTGPLPPRYDMVSQGEFEKFVYNPLNGAIKFWDQYEDQDVDEREDQGRGSDFMPAHYDIASRMGMGPDMDGRYVPGIVTFYPDYIAAGAYRMPTNLNKDWHPHMKRKIVERYAPLGKPIYWFPGTLNMNFEYQAEQGEKLAKKSGFINWLKKKAMGSSPIKVIEGTDYTDGQDEWWANRRAFIYVPEKNIIYLGALGTHHEDVEMEFGREAWGQSDDLYGDEADSEWDQDNQSVTFQGEITPEGNVNVWGSPEVGSQAIYEALQPWAIQHIKPDVEEWAPKTANVIQVIEGKDFYPGQDEYWSLRRALVYTPSENLIILGAPSSHHGNIKKEFPDRFPHGGEDHIRDRYWEIVPPQDGPYDENSPMKLSVYGRDNPGEVEAVMEALKSYIPNLYPPNTDLSEVEIDWAPRLGSEWAPEIQEYAPINWTPKDHPDVHVMEQQEEMYGMSGINHRKPYLYHKPTEQLYVGEQGDDHPTLADKIGIDYDEYDTSDFIVGAVQTRKDGSLLHSVYNWNNESWLGGEEDRGRGWEEDHRPKLEQLIGLPINNEYDPDRGFSEWFRETKTAMAFDPLMWQEILEHQGFGYHVTHRSNLESIMQKGVIPASEHGDPRDTGFWTPRAGHIYMFSNPDQAYESPRWQDEGYKGVGEMRNDPVMLQIDLSQLDPLKFKADEDYAYNYEQAHSEADIEDERLYRNYDESTGYHEFIDDPTVENMYGIPQPPRPTVQDEYGGELVPGKPNEYGGHEMVWKPHPFEGQGLGQWAEEHGLDDPKIVADSWIRSNTIAYEGVIPPSAIVKIYNYEDAYDPQDWAKIEAYQ